MADTASAGAARVQKIAPTAPAVLECLILTVRPRHPGASHNERFRVSTAIDSINRPPQARLYRVRVYYAVHQYFHTMRSRPDRERITLEWIQRVVDSPLRESVQSDGRIRRWAPIAEMDGRYLRVVLLSDGETVHNAFSTGGSGRENPVLSGYRHPVY